MPEEEFLRPTVQILKPKVSVDEFLGPVVLILKPQRERGENLVFDINTLKDEQSSYFEPTQLHTFSNQVSILVILDLVKATKLSFPYVSAE